MRRRKPSRRRRDEASINSAHSTAATVVDDRPLSSINIPTTPTRARALERGVSSDQPSPSRRRYLYRRAPPNIVARDTSQDVISRVDARHRARRSRGNFNRAHARRRRVDRARVRSFDRPTVQRSAPTNFASNFTSNFTSRAARAPRDEDHQPRVREERQGLDKGARAKPSSRASARRNGAVPIVSRVAPRPRGTRRRRRLTPRDARAVRPRERGRRVARV